MCAPPPTEAVPEQDLEKGHMHSTRDDERGHAHPAPSTYPLSGHAVKFNGQEVLGRS
ncbi:hypothetical protein T484DRAFT_1982712 [Baffinella frigidus]|nr:hypothetical protein T484DRAFT_1982712 [Cryptophyta sp. CCMP2293]